MKDAASLTESQLIKAIEQSDAACSAICDEMIASGRGHERHSETAKKDDPLSLRFRAVYATAGALKAERQRRMEWHGSLKRIRAAA